MTAGRDGRSDSPFVAQLNGERIEPMPGPHMLRVPLHTVEIDCGAFPPGQALDDREALAAFIDAASPVPLLPYQRDFLVGVLAERLRDPFGARLEGVKPVGLLNAFPVQGYPYKPRHKPRRPRKVPR